MTDALTHTDFKSDIKPVWCPGCGDFGVVNALGLVDRIGCTLAIDCDVVGEGAARQIGDDLAVGIHSGDRARAPADDGP
mgnify:CR=1 FL=1